MVIYSKRNIILPGPSGEKFRLNKGCEATVPAWAEGSSYLKALERDGKVILSASGRDFAANEKKPKKPKNPAKPPEMPDEPPKEEPSEREEQPESCSGEAPEGAS